MSKPKETIKNVKGLPAKKKTQYLAIIIVVAVILLIYFSTYTKSSSKGDGSGEDGAATTHAEASLEERLRAILSKVDGAGDVDVIINYESSSELVPAMSEDISTSANSNEDSASTTKNEHKDVTKVSGSDGDALIIKEIEPEVRGVVVVAQGAGSISVKLNLLEAVTTLLDVSADKVEVLKMNQ